MNSFLDILLWAVGGILSHGRYTAGWYEIDEMFIATLRPVEWWKRTPFLILGIFYFLLSWVGFVAGNIAFFTRQEKYYLKWSYQELHKKYNQNAGRVQ